jgi:hypothetical protein
MMDVDCEEKTARELDMKGQRERKVWLPESCVTPYYSRKIALLSAMSYLQSKWPKPSNGASRRRSINF